MAVVPVVHPDAVQPSTLIENPPQVPSPQANKPPEQVLPPPVPRPTLSPSGIAIAAANIAKTLCQLLNDTHERDRMFVLKEQLRRQDWEQLDLQMAIQYAIARELSSKFDAYFGVIEIFSKHYAWENMHRTVGRVDPMLSELMARYAARQWRLQVIANEYAGPDAKRRKLALDQLTSPVDEAAFKKFARWSRNLKTMRNLLGQLQSSGGATLRYEINSASANKWFAYLKTFPNTWDHILLLTFIGLSGGSIVLMSLLRYLDAWPPSGEQIKDLIFGGLSIVGIIAAPLLVDTLFRSWRRKFQQKLAEKYAALRQWVHHPGVIWAWNGVIQFGVFLTLWAESHPIFWIAVVVALAMIMVRDGSMSTIRTLAFLAWPLHIVIYVFLAAVLHNIPWAMYGLDGPPSFAFPHMLALLLYAPFTRTSVKLVSSVLRRPIRDAIKVSFWSSVLLLFAMMATAAALTPPASWPTLEAHPENRPENRSVTDSLNRTVPRETPKIPDEVN